MNFKQNKLPYPRSHAQFIALGEPKSRYETAKRDLKYAVGGVAIGAAVAGGALAAHEQMNDAAEIVTLAAAGSFMAISSKNGVNALRDKNSAERDAFQAVRPIDPNEYSHSVVVEPPSPEM